MIKKVLSILLILLTACVTEPSDGINSKKQWQSIPELEGMDIWDVKIHNDEIYVAGRDFSGKGAIYKSQDAIHWKVFAPSIGDSLDYSVMAIDFYNGNLIACATGKPLYLVTNTSITPLTKPIQNDVREIIVDKENNILIGTIGIYYCKYVTPDTVYNIYDSLSTPPTGGCFRQPAIVPVGISRFLKDKISRDILIGNYAFTNHFVTIFHNNIIDCFENEGLGENERYFGCHDMIFANDTLLAAGYAGIQYLDQNEWKVYGDTLPKTPAGTLTIATSIAYDEVRKETYVAANYIGIIKWDKNTGWKTLNEGLVSFNGLYDFVPDIIYFKGVLLLTYGTSKTYGSSSRGAMFLLVRRNDNYVSQLPGLIITPLFLCPFILTENGLLKFI